MVKSSAAKSDVGAPRTTKGGETRARILETALDLFRQRGYDETTMRAIAEGADVSLGNAYYYFTSKEHLIQAFYGRTHQEHLEASAPILAAESSFKARLLGVMHAKLATIEPYHRFAGILFKSAADPESPLHPFSKESGPVRDEATALMREVVDGSTIKLPDDLRAELPRLLWLYHMGVILFWIHDGSAKRQRTRTLIEMSVELIARLVSVGGNPLMRPVRKAVLRMVEGTKG
ncbi:MAG: TetR family transcriptional regulator [Gemmatimonadota bacterium]|nr:TetR family transcriptional regulator [Gemmatimonadota bacterium]